MIGTLNDTVNTRGHWGGKLLFPRGSQENRDRLEKRLTPCYTSDPFLWIGNVIFWPSCL